MKELEEYHIEVDVYDPWLIQQKEYEYNIQPINAQGEMTNANLIANEFTSKVDLIIAITTPSNRQH